MNYQDFINQEITKIEGASLMLAKKTHNIAEINKLAKNGYVPAIEFSIEYKAKNGEDYTELKNIFEENIPKNILEEAKKIINKKIEDVEPQYIKRKKMRMV